jgi:EAL domain-containing protein (putative c-di-GMP-specific phosphodiesterase class I)
VYLDDFGVGYSSLQYLRELGVDAVKLDNSFLAEVPESDASCTLVRGVVEMAHGLGLKTTVEGVERPEQLQYLQSIGCDTVQGYHTGRPMAVAKFIELLNM